MLQANKLTNFIFVFFISLLVSEPSLGASQDKLPLWTNDRKAHAALSAALSAGFYIVLKNSKYSKAASFFGSFIFSFTIGVSKEISDSEVSSKDLIADAVGAFSGSLLFVTFDF